VRRNKRSHPTKRQKPDQRPSESIAIGFASCTGLSILIADALRAAGIPARLAGAPRWTDESGNHTWVEVWDNGWHHIEAASPGPYDEAWFNEKAAVARPDDSLYRIYAASFKRKGLSFPLIWDLSIDYVAALNVTERYLRR
jgi:hypothetical protein